MKAIKFSILAAMMLTAGITTVKAQTADEILEKHQKAIGGADSWNKLKTLKMVGTLTQQGMEISMTQTIDIAKGARLDISVMGMTGYQIVTPNAGWMYMPFQGSTKVDTMKPDMVKAMQQQFDVKGHQLLDYKSKGTKVELAGKDTVNNAPCYKLKITDKDANESTVFIDMATYYILRTETKAKTDEGDQEMAVVYSDYKQTAEGGVVMPMSVTAQGVEITYKSIEVNKPIDEKTFIPTAPDKK